VQYIIEVVNRGLEISFDKGQFLEATLFGVIASTDDMREGTTAFLQKRKAEFKGR
jgi:enoyl-CoA hydratase